MINTYTVRAVDKSGGSLICYNKKGWSRTFYPAPTVLTAKYNGKEKEIVFGWKPVNGVKKYRVFRKVNGGKWQILFDTGNPMHNACINRKIKKGNTYSDTVRCLSADGKKYIFGYNAKGITVKY